MKKEKDHYGIKVLRGYRLEDGVFVQDWCTKRVGLVNVKHYLNCHHKLVKLSKPAYMYLLFITEQMDAEDNYFAHSKKLRDEFRKHMSSNCQTHWQDSTVKSAFQQLTKYGLVISYGGRVDYTVNPLHFFRGTEEAREELIRKLYAEASKTNVGSSIRKALGF